MQTKIWEPESSIKNELFDMNKALQPMCLQYLDAPFVHTQTDLGYDFVDSLRKCKDITVFDLKSVQILIDHQ